MAVLGIDGCPGGWVGARSTDDARALARRRLRRAARARRATVVAVDIPIGLPAGAARRRGRRRGPEPCSAVSARRSSSPRRGSSSRRSTSPTPPGCPGQPARPASASRCSTSSRKVAEVDALLRADAAAAARVVEVHPEVSFRALGAVRRPAAQAHGRRSRSAPRGAAHVAARRSSCRRRCPGGPRPDDCLDALACAWTATRWAGRRARTSSAASCDALGVPMRIVV